MTPQVESQYDNITIRNILGEDFYWQMGYDSNNEPVEFMLPADSEISLQRYPARHAIKKMIQQAIQKFEWHEVEKDFKGWYYWAINHGIDFSITSFLKKFPNLLFDFKTDRKINATGRTWAKANDVLGDSNEFPRLAGLVGEGIATQFCAYKEVFMEFPEVSDVETQPEKAKVPKNKDAQFALVYALIQHLNPKNWSAFVQYCGRMNKEYLTLFVTEALEHYPKQGYNKTPEYTKFIYENQKDLL